MAKLYFRYGTVGSAKTLNLLAVTHNYRQQGKKVCLLKPASDDRFGKELVRSRAGLEMTADILIAEDTNLLENAFTSVSCILVDEAQFLKKEHIDQLRHITLVKNIPVICYGLRTDFRTSLFEASKRLMEIADSIEEVKTTCYFCEKKAVNNLKHLNGIATLDGPSVQLGAEELYYPVCYGCYIKELDKSAKQKLQNKVWRAKVEKITV